MKLYHVEIVYEAVVLAENESEAMDFCVEIEREEERSDITAFPIDLDRPILPCHWDDDCYVYHKGQEDLRLGDVFDQLRGKTIKQSPGQMSLDVSPPPPDSPPLSRGTP